MWLYHRLGVAFFYVLHKVCLIRYRNLTKKIKALVFRAAIPFIMMVAVLLVILKKEIEVNIVTYESYALL